MTATDTIQSLDSLAGSYQLDPAHTRLGFAVRHMVTTVHGHFASFTGRIDLPGNDLERSTAEVMIDPASIQTSNPDRDAHLRSADFFDVDRYPTMSFRSTRVRREGDGRFAVVGDLTIKDITRLVDLQLSFQGSATDPYGQLRAGFTGSGVISRKAWGLTWNVALETGGFVLGDRITLELDGSAIKDA
jgi:polyisoprenoid-binding protein YceI